MARLLEEEKRKQERRRNIAVSNTRAETHRSHVMATMPRSVLLFTALRPRGVCWLCGGCVAQAAAQERVARARAAKQQALTLAEAEKQSRQRARARMDAETRAGVMRDANLPSCVRQHRQVPRVCSGSGRLCFRVTSVCVGVAVWQSIGARKWSGSGKVSETIAPLN